MLRLAAHHGPIPFFAAAEVPVERDSVVGRAVVERQVIHVQDLEAVVVTEFPRFQTFIHQEGTRTVLVAPLLREDVPIGAILIRRTEVRPFTEKQIALLKTFADQAVIAIENVRLFKEIAGAQRGIARSSGAADRDSRNAEHHQPLADRRAAGVRHHRRERGAVCGIDDLLLRLRDGSNCVSRAHFGSITHCPSRDQY